MSLIQQLQQLRGWAIVAGAWVAGLERVQKELTAQAGTADEIRSVQIQLAGWQLPALLVQERLSLGMEADAKLRAKEIPTERAGKPVLKNTDAILWRKRAAMAAEVVEHPGWQILVRHFVAMDWALVRLKAICPPEAGPTLDAVRKALRAPVRKLDEALDFGIGAEAWFSAQEDSGAGERGD
jgi:hypothetical protein